jgi:tRNA (mo5U34)-methyltransferase
MAARTNFPHTEPRPALTGAEREVADLLPIGASAAASRDVLERVPFWFHTFSLDGGPLYTPGVARDHRYRIPALPADLRGRTVLDVGTFDGFYAFLAESRGASRVVAVDNEQYRGWVRARWGVELNGGEGFRAIAELLGSGVEYRRLDAFDLELLGETFDLILCFGILHRVENPLGLLKVLRGCLAGDGKVLLETYGVTGERLEDEGEIHAFAAGEVYAHDEFVYWAFTGESLARLARHAGFDGVRIISTPTIEGHPRIVGRLMRGSSHSGHGSFASE